LSGARRLVWLAALLGALLPPGGPVAAQGGGRLSVRVGSAAQGWRPLLRTEGVLLEAPLRRALESGLPLRLHLRVELWQKRLFDRLVDAQEISLALVQDPLDRQYLLDTGRSERRFSSLAAVDAAMDDLLRLTLRPVAGARYYYLAELEMETLSLSDLEELRRWLRGDAAPALKGERAPERALRSGMGRVLVRVLGLPVRRYEARSEPFQVR
jgi:hypothetical protein